MPPLTPDERILLNTATANEKSMTQQLRLFSQSRRDAFWRAVNAKLAERSELPGTNGEIQRVYSLTTCPRQASEFIILARAATNSGEHR